MSQDTPSNEPPANRIVGVPAETFPDERRVALAPANVAVLQKAGVDVIIQSGAGTPAGYADDEYAAAGAKLIVLSGRCVFCQSLLLCFDDAEQVASPLESIMKYTLGQ